MLPSDTAEDQVDMGISPMEYDFESRDFFSEYSKDESFLQQAFGTAELIREDIARFEMGGFTKAKEHARRAYRAFTRASGEFGTLNNPRKMRAFLRTYRSELKRIFDEAREELTHKSDLSYCGGLAHHCLPQHHIAGRPNPQSCSRLRS